MKIFDLALKHLDGVDLTVFDLGNSQQDIPLNNEEKKMGMDLVERQKRFREDPRNNMHNDFYKDSIFIFAIYHLAFKSKDIPSAWDVALEIVENNQDVLKSDHKKYLNTEYPQTMVDKWLAYCRTKPEIDFLGENSQLRMDFFFAAYHYVVDGEFA